MKQYIDLSCGYPITDCMLRIYQSILKEKKIVKSSPNKNQRNNAKKRTYYYGLGEQYPNVYLSLREAQCVALWLENCTNTEIAKILNLSARTVEFYFNNVKAKLNANSKNKILEIIKNTDFIKNIENVKRLIT